MRKIEAQMVDAIRGFQTVNLGNTAVNCRVRADGVQVVSVYLHGNLIAQRGASGWGFKLCGWNTPTTLSRINAILSSFSTGRVYSKGGVPHFKHGAHDHPINLHDWQFVA